MDKNSNDSTDSIMTDVNLKNIEILDHANVELYFLNSHDGRPCKKILCYNVFNFSFGTCGDIEEFPVFICDVKLQTLKGEEAQPVLNSFPNAFKLSEQKECQFLLLESGEIRISIICESVGQEDES